MPIAILDNLTAQPSPARAQHQYRRLAQGYDATCGRIESLRLRAIDALRIEAGETVFDIACGTGPALPILAELVGKAGKVFGVELSPEMANQANDRVIAQGVETRAQVIQAAVREFHPLAHADAVLMCYTQDVLQCEASLDQLLRVCKPGARIAILGMKTLPWLWGWPVNAVNLYRARHYMTTYANLDRPWRALERRGAKITMIESALMGSAYIALGTLASTRPPKETSFSLR